MRLTIYKNSIGQSLTSAKLQIAERLSIDAGEKTVKDFRYYCPLSVGWEWQRNLFKDRKMLQLFLDISYSSGKKCLLTTVDHFIKSAKINAM